MLHVHRQRLAIGIALTALICVCQAQVIGNEQEAVYQASALLKSIGFDYSVENAQVNLLKDAGARPWRWTVDSATGEFTIGFSPTGKLESFCDGRLSSETEAPRKGVKAIKSSDQAWQVGEDVLRRCGLWTDKYKKGTSFDHSSHDSTAQGRVNGGGRYVLNFEERYLDYPGPTAMASVSLDAMSGRPILFTTASWNFVPPQRTISEGEALEKFRSTYALEQAVWEEQNRGSESPYVWPGDDAVRGSMRLGVSHTFRRTVSSDVGVQLAKDRKARLVWTSSAKGVLMALDAETGDLVESDLVKSRSQTQPVGRAKPTRPTSENSNAPIAIGASIVALMVGGFYAVRKRM